MAENTGLRDAPLAPRGKTEFTPALNVPPTQENDPDLELMIKLRTYAATRSVDVHRLLLEAGGKKTSSGAGSISKVKFMSALLDAFHNMAIPKDGLQKLAAKYACGPFDVRQDCHLEVAWVAFVQDLMSLQPTSRPPTERATITDGFA